MISREDDLLETGGGIAKALPLLGAAPFYAANADVVWRDGPMPALHRLARAWVDDDMDALLLLASTVRSTGYDGYGDFLMDPVGLLERRPERVVAPFVFTGVQILHPRLFAGAPDGAFSMNVLYDRALDAGRLFGIAMTGTGITSVRRLRLPRRMPKFSNAKVPASGCCSEHGNGHRRPA